MDVTPSTEFGECRTHSKDKIKGLSNIQGPSPESLADFLMMDMFEGDTTLTQSSMREAMAADGDLHAMNEPWIVQELGQTGPRFFLSQESDVTTKLERLSKLSPIPLVALKAAAKSMNNECETRSPSPTLAAVRRKREFADMNHEENLASVPKGTFALTEENLRRLTESMSPPPQLDKDLAVEMSVTRYKTFFKLETLRRERGRQGTEYLNTLDNFVNEQNEVEYRGDEKSDSNDSKFWKARFEALEKGRSLPESIAEATTIEADATISSQLPLSMRPEYLIIATQSDDETIELASLQSDEAHEGILSGRDSGSIFAKKPRQLLLEDVIKNDSLLNSSEQQSACRKRRRSNEDDKQASVAKRMKDEKQPARRFPHQGALQASEQPEEAVDANTSPRSEGGLSGRKSRGKSPRENSQTRSGDETRVVVPFSKVWKQTPRVQAQAKPSMRDKPSVISKQANINSAVAQPTMRRSRRLAQQKPELTGLPG